MRVVGAHVCVFMDHIIYIYTHTHTHTHTHIYILIAKMARPCGNTSEPARIIFLRARTYHFYKGKHIPFF
jgi:hypothetical protein